MDPETTPPSSDEDAGGAKNEVRKAMAGKLKGHRRPGSCMAMSPKLYSHCADEGDNFCLRADVGVGDRDDPPAKFEIKNASPLREDYDNSNLQLSCCKTQDVELEQLLLDTMES